MTHTSHHSMIHSLTKTLCLSYSFGFTASRVYLWSVSSSQDYRQAGHQKQRTQC